MNSAKPVIVVIEDDPQICRFLRTSLSVQGFQVIEAGTGERGVVEVGTRKPELVILDLGLPGMDGIEVIRKVREWSAVPIIVLSARSQESNKISRVGCRSGRLPDQTVQHRRTAGAHSRIASPRRTACRRRYRNAV